MHASSPGCNIGTDCTIAITTTGTGHQVKAAPIDPKQTLTAEVHLRIGGILCYLVHLLFELHLMAVFDSPSLHERNYQMHIFFFSGGFHWSEDLWVDEILEQENNSSIHRLKTALLYFFHKYMKNKCALFGWKYDAAICFDRIGSVVEPRLGCTGLHQVSHWC